MRSNPTGRFYSAVGVECIFQRDAFHQTARRRPSSGRNLNLPAPKSRLPVSIYIATLTVFERLKRACMTLNSMPRLPRCEDIAISNRVQEHTTVFDARFSRCRGLLHFIACRVLASNEGAEDAVKNCWRSASCNPPKFEYEGAFRSWLLRILIAEALALLRKKKVSTSDGNPDRDAPSTVPDFYCAPKRGLPLAGTAK